MRKNILILISESSNNSDYRGWIEKIFLDENIDIYVVSNNLERIDQKLSTADYILNFIEEKNDFEYIQKKIELLKIPFFGNRLMDIKLFSKKDNFKKIIEKSNFKTPVFEKISSRSPVELFNNFIHPSRIFSKENNFFSSENKSLTDLEDIFNSVGENITEYFIEEFIKGDNIYVFLLPGEDGKKNIFPVIEGDGIFKRLNREIEEKVIKKINEFMEYTDIEGFVLFNLIYSEKRGIYFLNIFLQNNILFKYHKILDKILGAHNYLSLKEVFKKYLF